jgi:Kef-type K+ transport system membrane component KefB/Trk K+ transport system NAD-binding subunit
MADLIFVDIGVIIIVATIVAYIARKFKQPLIPAYILAGLIIGPLLNYIINWEIVTNLFNISTDFELISNHHFISTLSEIGIAFLLFMVGLEIDLRKLKSVEKLAGYGGFFQVFTIFVFGFVASMLMLFSKIEAVYIGFIVAFSSTMVVVKILSDRKEIDTLHGRIILGFLIVQDFIAIFALIILNSLGNFALWQLLFSIFGGFSLLLIAIFLSKYVFSKLFKFAATSHELFFLVSLTICFAFSLLFHKVGLSIAIGAFVAGISLGNLPYNFEIIARVKSLRDFFATLFFVSLGMQLPLHYFSEILLPLIVLILIVLILKPIMFLVIIGAFGYKKRTSFLTAISLAQVSEFSLILITQGMLLGHVSEQLFAATILLAIITITFSSYFMKYEYNLYTYLAHDLTIFEKFNTHEEKLEYIPKVKHEVVLIGYDRTGYSIFHKLLKLKQKFLVIDFNPEIIKKLIRQKIPCIYGDVGNLEILEKLDFVNMKYLISTIPDQSSSLLLIKKVKKINDKVSLFMTAYQVEDALKLYDAGADYVVLPHFLGGHHASILLEEATKDISKLIKRKVKHIKELNHRKKIGHEHPHIHNQPQKHH